MNNKKIVQKEFISFHDEVEKLIDLQKNISSLNGLGYLDRFFSFSSYHFKTFSKEICDNLQNEDFKGFLYSLYAETYHLRNWCKIDGNYIYKNKEYKCGCIKTIKKIEPEVIEKFKKNKDGILKNISFNSFSKVYLHFKENSWSFQNSSKELNISETQLRRVIAGLEKLNLLEEKRSKQDRRFKVFKTLKIDAKKFILIKWKKFKKYKLNLDDINMLNLIKNKSYNNDSFEYNFFYISKWLKLTKIKIYKMINKLTSFGLIEKEIITEAKHKNNIASCFYLKQKILLD